MLVAARVAPSFRRSRSSRSTDLFQTGAVAVLSRVNRISKASDFRTTVRTGRKTASRHCVVYLIPMIGEPPTRFGFIVSKAVGNSVVRHFVTRRLRAVAHDLLPVHSSGLDVIVRALPGADRVEWTILRAEVATALAAKTQSRRSMSEAKV